MMILPCCVGWRKDWRSHSGSHFHHKLLVHIRLLPSLLFLCFLLLNLDSFLYRLIKAHVHVKFSSASELAMLPPTRLRRRILWAFLWAKELSWGFFLLCLGLGRALEVVVGDAVCRHYKGRLEFLGTEHHRGLVQALLLSRFSQELIWERKVLLDVDVTLSVSHVRKPPSLPNRLSLCSVKLTPRLPWQLSLMPLP